VTDTMTLRRKNTWLLLQPKDEGWRAKFTDPVPIAILARCALAGFCSSSL
jgi:hypothetical protein